MLLNMSLAVETRNLVKIYNGRVKALDSVNINIETGKITCLLGPNGAGKTTFLRVIATQLLPTSGEAYVLGYDVIKEAKKIRRHIAVVPQEGRPYFMVTPFDELYMGARILGFSRSEARDRALEILKKLDLYEVRFTKIIKLSGGQRQKVLLGRTLVSDADILFLDEPTLGLDPVSRRAIWNDILNLKREGKTILLTTHYMEEAETLADYLYIMNKGKVISEGRVGDIISSIGFDTAVYIMTDSSSAGEKLSQYEYEQVGNKFLVKVRDKNELYDIVRLAVENGYIITIKQPSLEDVFIKLVGEYEEVTD